MNMVVRIFSGITLDFSLLKPQQMSGVTSEIIVENYSGSCLCFCLFPNFPLNFFRFQT